MKNLLVTFASISLSVITFSQNTLTLQPNSADGKDASIWYLASQSGTFGSTNDSTYDYFQSFQAMEWTWNGILGTRKSLIDFDLSSLPANSVITNAQLSLYAFPTSPDGGHSILSGSNECTLEQIVSAWDENTVTWNTQPATTSVNSVPLVASATATQNYLDIDVTAMMQAEYANPSGNHGIMLSLDSQDNYRSMIFGSSENLNAALRPKLVITYSSSANLPKASIENSIEVYPNPTEGSFSVKMEGEYQFEIENVFGQTILCQSESVIGTQTIDMNDFPAGTYFVQLISKERTFTRKVVIQ